MIVSSPYARTRTCISRLVRSRPRKSDSPTCAELDELKLQPVDRSVGSTDDSLSLSLSLSCNAGIYHVANWQRSSQFNPAAWLASVPHD